MSVPDSLEKAAWGAAVMMVLTSSLALGGEQNGCMETAKTQLKVNQCAAGELKAADAELNRVYQAILMKYKAQRTFVESLRKAQRAWVRFRDAELAARFPGDDKQSRYGSAYPMCANLFLAKRTRERVAQLREWLSGAEEGDVCAGSVQYRSAP
jgi:uncharacterized protein YecT (DUF1311 family)